MRLVYSCHVLLSAFNCIFIALLSPLSLSHKSLLESDLAPKIPAVILIIFQEINEEFIFFLGIISEHKHDMAIKNIFTLEFSKYEKMSRRHDRSLRSARFTTYLFSYFASFFLGESERGEKFIVLAVSTDTFRANKSVTRAHHHRYYNSQHFSVIVCLGVSLPEGGV